MDIERSYSSNDDVKNRLGEKIMDHYGRKRTRPDYPGEYQQRPDFHEHYDRRTPPPPPPDYDNRQAPRRPGRGRDEGFRGDAPFAPVTEYKILVDVNAFPINANVISQILGPRGRHQQRMTAESDAIISTSGKGIRGEPLRGEEPLSLVVRSKNPQVPLTERQVVAVHQVYDDLMRNVREYVEYIRRH
jgi:hypothetical protein